MKKIKEFFPTSWSIDNKTSVYVITFILTIWGILAYIKLQKENFPDIVIPTIITGVIYPGTSPSDMENLVTRPLEKEIKTSLLCINQCIQRKSSNEWTKYVRYLEAYFI